MGRTLGLLTSGGDCAGLNAAIHAAALTALRRGWRVLGIAGGTTGLMETPPRYCEMTQDMLATFPFRAGGTVLGTINRGNPFQITLPDGSVQDRSVNFAAGVQALGLNALVVIGGDGSMRILNRLCKPAGIPMIGIPKTIDNDVPGTDTAIGFSTAVQVVSDSIDRLQPTAASHHRVMVLEVMGREAGHIALHGGIAGGADAIVLPEIGLRMEALIDHLRHCLDAKGYALVVVAEGVRCEGVAGSIGGWLAQQIEAQAGAESRCTVLGHLQRGGSPNAQDRLLASAFGTHAIELLEAGDVGRMVAWRNHRLCSVPLETAVTGPRLVDPADELIATARQLGTVI